MTNSSLQLLKKWLLFYEKLSNLMSWAIGSLMVENDVKKLASSGFGLKNLIIL